MSVLHPCFGAVGMYTNTMPNTENTTPRALTLAHGWVFLSRESFPAGERFVWRAVQQQRVSRFFGTEAEALRFAPA